MLWSLNTFKANTPAQRYFSELCLAFSREQLWRCLSKSVLIVAILTFGPHGYNSLFRFLVFSKS